MHWKLLSTGRCLFQLPKKETMMIKPQWAVKRTFTYDFKPKFFTVFALRENLRTKAKFENEEDK
jgi:endo-1,4-beta-mannosidase